jgi:hypothetical protein
MTMKKTNASNVFHFIEPFPVSEPSSDDQVRNPEPIPTPPPERKRELKDRIRRLVENLQQPMADVPEAELLYLFRHEFSHIILELRGELRKFGTNLILPFPVKTTDIQDIIDELEFTIKYRL